MYGSVVKCNIVCCSLGFYCSGVPFIVTACPLFSDCVFQVWRDHVKCPCPFLSIVSCVLPFQTSEPLRVGPVGKAVRGRSAGSQRSKVRTTCSAERKPGVITRATTLASVDAEPMLPGANSLKILLMNCRFLFLFCILVIPSIFFFPQVQFPALNGNVPLLLISTNPS